MKPSIKLAPLALMVLTAVTVWVAYQDLGVFNDMVALAIDSGQYIESRPGLFLKRKGYSD